VGHETSDADNQLSVHTIGYASTLSLPSIATIDPAHTEAASLLQTGTKLLEEGDVDGALSKYSRSVELVEWLSQYDDKIN
jgi:hypothetical protein